jgi:hypothetical protein
MDVGVASSIDVVCLEGIRWSLSETLVLDHLREVFRLTPEEHRHALAVSKLLAPLVLLKQDCLECCTPLTARVVMIERG